jgi:choline dehydrogenase-like flavoprotein
LYSLFTMHIDGRNIKKGSILTADVCIVGAGAAGITIARALANTSVEVCLLESGGLNSSGGAQSLYEGENVGLPYFPLNGCRLRYFGGTTNHWAGWCSPLDEIDMQERQWVPYSGWPISLSELGPYYASAQRICELDSFKYDTEYWAPKFKESSLLPFSPSKITHSVTQLSPPTRFGQRYRQDVIKASNVTLVTHANVTQIRTPVNGSTVSELQVDCLNGNTFRVKASQYVLACGGIENPRLLLSSNEYTPNGLGNDHDLVGRFFMEHPRMTSAVAIFDDRQRLSPYKYGEFYSEYPDIFFQFKPSEEQQQSAKLLNMVIRFDYTSSGYFSARKLIQLLRARKLRFGSNIDYISEAVSNVVADFEGVLRGANNTLLGNPPYNKFKVLSVETVVEQAPNPASRVRLGDDRDALGLRKVELDWRLSEQEKRSIRIGNRLLGEELGRTGLGRLRLREWLQQDNNTSWPSDLLGSWHHMGTTRMGINPKYSVCDSQCRLHGVDNLYIAGSSVFPTGGSEHPTLTIVALSLRLADHLKKNHIRTNNF